VDGEYRKGPKKNGRNAHCETKKLTIPKEREANAGKGDRERKIERENDSKRGCRQWAKY